VPRSLTGVAGLCVTLLIAVAGGAAVPPTVAHGAAGPGVDRPDVVRPGVERPATRDQYARRAHEPTGWGPTNGEVRRARELVEQMTLAQRAGQVVVAGYRGTGSPARLVRRLHLGGVVPVAENITSSGQIQAVNASVQRVVRGRGYPAFIGVDQEGGTVVRVRDAATRFPAFMSAGAAHDPALTGRAAAAGAREMRGLGFTSVLAPVADVTRGPADPVIGTRSSSGYPRLAAEQVVAAEQGIASAGVIATLKHFPGHGSVTVDSHQALPVLGKSLPELRRTDLVPFRRGIAAGASAVMVGHLDVRAVDPGVPSSLSRLVVDGLLRQELGFRGLVLTDSLSMGAVTERFGPAKAAVRAVNAGVDVVLMPADAGAAREGIIAAVRDRRMLSSRLDEAATRMIALLLHVAHSDVRPVALGASWGVSARLSSAALTSVAGPCSGRLVGGRVRVIGPADAVAAFRAAAQRRGLAVAKRGVRIALLPGRVVGRPPRAGVVVALDRPDVLTRTDAPVRLATYGATPGAMDALVAFLVGDRTAPGQLPLRVPGIPRTGC
jgi:beta-N-acetylhexosaminidase